MNVGLIGPIHPFRSGESQSNTMLCENLSENHNITAYSFKRLYPNFLFPGKSPYYESQKTLNFKREFIIDAINPFSWISSFFRIKKDKPDVVIVTWWTIFLSPCYLVLLSLIKNFTKMKICIFAHNVYPHEDSILNKVLTKPVLALGDYFIVFSSKTLRDLKEIFPESKVKILIETTYDNHFKQKSIDREVARKKVGIDGNISLFFGLVREYKGLKYLVEAIPLILQKIDVKFLIVGEFWEDKNPHIERIQQLGVEDNVIIIDRFVPDEEAVSYFSAADIFLLPYVSATYSAIIPLAYGYGKPVVVSDILGLTDLVDDAVTGYIVPPKNPKAIAESIIKFFTQENRFEFEKNVREKQKIFNWSQEKEDTVFHGLY